MESSEAGWEAGGAGGVSSGGEHLQKVSVPAVFSFPLRGLDLPGRSCRKKDSGSKKLSLIEEPLTPCWAQSRSWMNVWVGELMFRWMGERAARGILV